MDEIFAGLDQVVIELSSYHTLTTPATPPTTAPTGPPTTAPTVAPAAAPTTAPVPFPLVPSPLVPLPPVPFPYIQKAVVYNVCLGKQKRAQYYARSRT